MILFTFCFYFETHKNVTLSTNRHFYLLSIRVGRRQPVLLVVIQCGKKTASSTCCQSGKKTASSTCCHSVWEEDCQFYLLSFSVGRRLPVLLLVSGKEDSQFYLLSIRVCSLSTSSLEMLSTCLVLWCSAISVNKQHMPQVVKQRQ